MTMLYALPQKQERWEETQNHWRKNPAASRVSSEKADLPEAIAIRAKNDERNEDTNDRREKKSD